VSKNETTKERDERGIEKEKEKEKSRTSKRDGRHSLEVLLKRAKTFSRFFPFSPILARSAKMHPRNCRLQ